MTDPVQQVDTVIRLLSGKKWNRESPAFKTALQWLANFPTVVDASRKTRLMQGVCYAFDTTEQEVYSILSGIALPKSVETQTALAEADLESVIPKDGWLRMYAEYTRYIESPLSYNLFCSMCALGSALGRRVWKDKGFFKIYPNFCTLLIGPPAIAKTTAINIARWFVEKADCCPIFADKMTPESVPAALIERGTHQLVCSDELSVFLSKARYNEGLVVLMNRLLEAPDKHRIRTQARGEEEIENVFISMMGASTPSLLASATPEQTTSSGFLSRFIIVTETKSSRVFWEPVRGALSLENKMLMVLERLKQTSGEITYSPQADAFGKQWYEDRKRRIQTIDDDVAVEVGSRLAIHLERTAMLLHLADHKDRVVCLDCFKTAAGLVEYSTKTLPTTINAIKHSSKSQEADYVVDQLKKAGGAADHSKLLRMCSNRGINATAFKSHIQTLKEQHIVREEIKGTLRFYLLEDPNASQT